MARALYVGGHRILFLDPASKSDKNWSLSIRYTSANFDYSTRIDGVYDRQQYIVQLFLFHGRPQLFPFGLSFLRPFQEIRPTHNYWKTNGTRDRRRPVNLPLQSMHLCTSRGGRRNEVSYMRIPPKNLQTAVVLLLRCNSWKGASEK